MLPRSYNHHLVVWNLHCDRMSMALETWEKNMVKWTWDQRVLPRAPVHTLKSMNVRRGLAKVTVIENISTSFYRGDSGCCR